MVKNKSEEPMLFNKILRGLSKMFGGLEYNDMRIKNAYANQLSEEEELKKEWEFIERFQWDYKIDKFEYLEEQTPFNEWNQKGLEGWEMVQRDSDKSIIWKRKIN